jgi:hypothetical protein
MTGLTTKFSVFVGCWPVSKLTGCQLFFLTVHVVKKLEEIGFIVDRVVADNAKINVKFFKLLRRANDPKLFLSYDYTHIIKNARKQLIDRNRKN